MTEILEALIIDPDAEWQAWFTQYTFVLDQIPVLIEAIRHDALRTLRATPTDVVRVSGSSEKSRAPFTVDGVDDADELWALLVLYTGEVAARIPYLQRPPIGRVWSTRREVAGIRADADPLSARKVAADVVQWLLDHIHLADGTNLVDSETHLRDRVRALRGRYGPRTVRRFQAEFCGLCGANSVTTDWVDSPDHTAGRVLAPVCGVCGHVHLTTNREIGEQR